MGWRFVSSCVAAVVVVSIFTMFDPEVYRNFLKTCKLGMKLQGSSYKADRDEKKWIRFRAYTHPERQVRGTMRVLSSRSSQKAGVPECRSNSGATMFHRVSMVRVYTFLRSVCSNLTNFKKQLHLTRSLNDAFSC